MNDIYRLGIISDTHISHLSSAVDLAEQLLNGPFTQVDAILHAGDMVLADFADCFGDIPFYAVQGNMDAPRADLPLKRIIKLGEFRIGLIHGWGAPDHVPQNVCSAFAADAPELDLLIFGHSHTPYLKRVGQTILFNPGSALDHRGFADSCSVGLVEIGQQIRARHIPFEFTA